MFLETEAAFPYCNFIYLFIVIGCLPFLSLFIGNTLKKNILISKICCKFGLHQYWRQAQQYFVTLISDTTDTLLTLTDTFLGL